jgi:hypothetical protein
MHVGNHSNATLAKDENVWGPFDQHALFNTTDVMCQRCCELREILSSLRHTNDILVRSSQYK